MYKVSFSIALLFVVANNIALAQGVVPQWALPNSIASGGFINSTEVTLLYTEKYFCSPPINSLFAGNNQTAAALAYTACEAGMPGNASGAEQLWAVIPAFAGLTIFGVGGSTQGFPTYQNTTIITQCGAGGTQAACPDHPTYIYSPLFASIEDYIGNPNGMLGLPVGVLPTPTHDHVMFDSEMGADAKWYNIGVFVFDPNIMPNATTGACRQLVPSNLTDPTANCLTSVQALERAITNSSSSVGVANANNPIWEYMGRPNAQIVIPGDPTVAQINDSNTNIVIPYIVNNRSYYKIQFNAQTTSPQLLAIIGAVVGLMVVAAGAAFWMRSKSASSGKK